MQKKVWIQIENTKKKFKVNKNKQKLKHTPNKRLLFLFASSIFYFFVTCTKKAQSLKVLGGGNGSGHALTKKSKGTELATFADPFNSTIYNHSSFIMRAAVTKIPHLLYEEDLLKTRKWYMIFIYKIWFMYNDMMGMGEKKPEKIYIQFASSISLN